jgi:hypothetical protein
MLSLAGYCTITSLMASPLIGICPTSGSVLFGKRPRESGRSISLPAQPLATWTLAIFHAFRAIARSTISPIIWV